MVLLITIQGDRYYACNQCLFIYKEQETARACEEWCVKHRSCNREITSRSIGRIIKMGKHLRIS